MARRVHGASRSSHHGPRKECEPWENLAECTITVQLTVAQLALLLGVPPWSPLSKTISMPLSQLPANQPFEGLPALGGGTDIC